MDFFAPLFTDLQILARPALFNLYFAATSIVAAFGLAVLLALGKDSGNPLLSRACRAYIYAFRGSPLFIQFFMFYSIMLSLNQSHWKPMNVDWFVLHPLFLGPLVLTLNTTAYTGEIFHGALRAVPRGEVEAARAFGMSGWQRFRAVTWPHMIRLAWPAYTNEVVFLIQATALVYFALPVIDEQKDLMNKAGELFERDYNAFLHFPAAGIYFMAISFAVFFLFSRIYERMNVHTQRPQSIRFAMRWNR